jgi:hypothetical protein
MIELLNNLIISSGPLDSSLRKSYPENEVPFWNGKKNCRDFKMKKLKVWEAKKY